jgi:SnoaL-like domain
VSDQSERATELSLADRSEITELLSRYGLLLDQQRVDEWMELFAPDAVLEIEGRGSLRTVEDRLELGRTAPQGTHLCAPPVIRAGDSGGTARAEQTFMFRSAELGQLLAGWYEDVLVKFGDRWHFRERSIRFHRHVSG